MDIGFSINMYDQDGEKFEDGVILHIDNVMIKFKDKEEFDHFVSKINSIKNELDGNI